MGTQSLGEDQSLPLGGETNPVNEKLRLPVVFSFGDWEPSAAWGPTPGFLFLKGFWRLKCYCRFRAIPEAPSVPHSSAVPWAYRGSWIRETYPRSSNLGHSLLTEGT